MLCFFTLLIIIIFLAIYLINTSKKMKNFENNEELNIITRKLPDDITVCEEILELINNNSVKVTKDEATKTNLYTVYNNKIILSGKNIEYLLIQTIAHECLHSIQNKFVLWMNFIISNINILYYIGLIILTLFNKITNTSIHMIILLSIGALQLITRGYLELDAMTKAKNLAKKYLEQKKEIEIQEKELLITKYSTINKIGIPAIIVNMIINFLIKIVIYFGLTIL